MTSLLLPGGSRFLAELLAGSDKRINGMYVEYTSDPVTFNTDKTPAYFEGLLHSKNAGYARIPVQSVTIDKDGIVVFTGLLTSEDLKGGKLIKASALTGATLVHMQDDITAHDTLIYSTLFTQPVAVLKGVYTNVSVKLAIGA